jgi:hypothetical protein
MVFGHDAVNLVGRNKRPVAAAQGNVKFEWFSSNESTMTGNGGGGDDWTPGSTVELGGVGDVRVVQSRCVVLAGV